MHVHGSVNSVVRFHGFTFLIVFPACRYFDLDSVNVKARAPAYLIVTRWNFVKSSLFRSLAYAL